MPLGPLAPRAGAFLLAALVIVSLAPTGAADHPYQSCWLGYGGGSLGLVPPSGYADSDRSYQVFVQPGSGANWVIDSIELRFPWESNPRTFQGFVVSENEYKTTSPVTTHLPSPGSFLLRVNVTGHVTSESHSYACYRDVPFEVGAVLPPPTASLRHTGDSYGSGPAPHTVTLLAAVTQGEPGFDYAWAWGDGTTSSGGTGDEQRSDDGRWRSSVTMSHTYRDGGAPTLVLTVTDARGRAATASLSFTVATADQDRDLHTDGFDNCPRLANANQIDSDEDGLGNVCDATPFGTRVGPGHSTPFPPWESAAASGCGTEAAPISVDQALERSCARVAYVYNGDQAWYTDSAGLNFRNMDGGRVVLYVEKGQVFDAPNTAFSALALVDTMKVVLAPMSTSGATGPSASSDGGGPARTFSIHASKGQPQPGTYYEWAWRVEPSLVRVFDTMEKFGAINDDARQLAVWTITDAMTPSEAYGRGFTVDEVQDANRILVESGLFQIDANGTATPGPTSERPTDGPDVTGGPTPPSPSTSIPGPDAAPLLAAMSALVMWTTRRR